MSSASWVTHDWLAAGCGQIVRVWDPSDAKTEVKLYDGTDVYSLDFSRNNKVLAVAGDKGQISLYSAKAPEKGSNRVISSFPSTPEVDIDAFTCVKFGPNDAYLAAGTSSGTIHAWSLKGGLPPQKLPALKGAVTSIAIHNDMIAATSSTGQVQVYETRTWSNFKTLVEGRPLKQGNACFSHVAPMLAVGHGDGTIALWDAQSYARLRDLAPHQGAVTGLAFSETSADLLMSCSEKAHLKCTDFRTRKDAWSVACRQPCTTLSAKYDGQLVAVGNTAGAVHIYDVRSIKAPMYTQQFSDSSATVSVVRWQHLHVAKSSRPSSSAASAATSTVTAATGAGSRAGSAAASRQQQQREQSVLHSHRPSAAAAAAAPPAPDTAAAGSHPRSPGRGAGKGSTGGALDREPSSTSVSASMEFGMRAFSPVQMYGDEADTDDAATSALNRPSAATAAPTSVAPNMRTPEMATPGESTMSAGPGVPFMFTPGIGLGLGGSSTPGGLAVTPDITPVSRPAGMSATAALAPAAAAPPPPATTAAEPPPATAATGSLSWRESSSGIDKAIASPRVSGRQSAGGRAPLPSSAAAAAGHTAAASGGSTAAASGGGRTGIGSRHANGLTTSTSAAAGSSSRPLSRSGSASGMGLGSRKSSSRGLSDTGEPAGTAGAAAAGGSSSRMSSVLDAMKATDVAGGRPSSAAGAAGTLTAMPSGGLVAGGLREDVFKSYIDQQFEELRADVRNMHLDMLKQFHQAQMDLVSVVDGLAQRQDQLAEAITELTTAVQGLRTAKQLPGAGLLGAMPWI